MSEHVPYDAKGQPGLFQCPHGLLPVIRIKALGESHQKGNK